MSRYCGNMDPTATIAAAEQWRDRCLLDQGAVFSDAKLWTPELIADVRAHFGSNASEGNDRFIEKLEDQLSDRPPEVQQLSAEILWLMLLCPSNISAAKKRETIMEVYGWSGTRLDPGHPLLSDVTLRGVGSGGTAYNNYRPREAAYCIEILSRFKAEPVPTQRTLIADGGRFAEWLESIPDNASRQFRHMLLFMLFPDDFERSFGRADRCRIVQRIEGLSQAQVRKLSPVELDRKLAAIRARAAKELGEENLDFYVPPLSKWWQKQASQTYLLTWNPGNAPWESFETDRSSTAAGRKVTRHWPCANGKAAVGDQVYLIQTGETLRGAIARGNIVSAPTLQSQPNPARAEEGQESAMIEVEFTDIRDPARDPFISAEQLKPIGAGNPPRPPQQSCIVVDPVAAAQLDKFWNALPPLGPGPNPVVESEPQNLILYGPPGTGKTHSIRKRIEEYTTRSAEIGPWRDSLIEEMKWYEVVFCALHEINKPTRVADLAAHEYVKRKARLLGRTKNIRNTLWNALGVHAVRDSDTVAFEARSEPLVFDKDAESRWRLAGSWEEELADLVKTAATLERGPDRRSAGMKRYEFVTFHQAYS